MFRAIERKDVVFLMEIRDHAFHLLLRKTGDATPLLHAMRVGASHRDVAIILLGAFSRWVNHLEDEEVTKPKTKALLKALRKCQPPHSVGESSLKSFSHSNQVRTSS